MTVLLWLCAAEALAEGVGTATDLTPAEESMPLAEDITAMCLFNGKSGIGTIRDGNNRTVWESAVNHGEHRLLITPPEGLAAGGLVIKWQTAMPARVQVTDDAGQWQTVAESVGEYQTQYIPLPDITTEFRLVGGENERQQIHIYEITVLTPGRLPDWVQVWQEAPSKIDLMLLSTHPDDELLWFGGLLPTYAGEQKKNVLVVCGVHRSNYRKIELLDALWYCGVRSYPVFLGLEDMLNGSRDDVLTAWGRQQTIRQVAALYRQYRPDVVMLQDVNGEYGHSVHQAFSYVGRKGVALAADAEETAQYDPGHDAWAIPKVYVHLWEENQLQMDWNQPLSAFRGRSAMDVAEEALRYHASQTANGWSMARTKQWDNSLFGLYWTTVGLDEKKDDLFEHIE